MTVTISAPIVVVGALNLDVYGVPSGPLRLRDSNPGRVTLGAGGVGHNMARHLAAAGMPVELLTVLGDDDAADILVRLCGGEGIGLRYAPRLACPSGVYLSVHDADGDMVAAINDMALMDHFTPDVLAQMMPIIDAAPLAIVDANLPAETLALLAQTAKAPLLLDPVSGFKAERARPVIGRFAVVKPNLLEAQTLSGEAEPARAAAWFLDQGVGRVFISLGDKGVYYAGAGARGTLPATPMHAPNCSGAGDALAAGIALGLLRGGDALACAQTGIQIVTQHLLRQGGSIL